MPMNLVSGVCPSFIGSNRVKMLCAEMVWVEIVTNMFMWVEKTGDPFIQCTV